MELHYNMTDTSPLIDGVRVIDGRPTGEDVCEFGDLILAVNPTPCGYYDGDPDRWEVSRFDCGGENGCALLGDFIWIGRTLDDAINHALSMCSKVYIVRDAV